ncbi:DUF3570 domain-containing protein [Permianibacter sp. IMCC34836]|uniref:DUF3570 domain-containing protein n=1 Tax=Permianibacter fluminis TaxID=2738515 RepID=UPI00155221FC|nr:DUF3570 domain-containing protein [Permianibacter fluminis]NQD36764.1 DUF3570 domain-containing protein [Permianibacter fluminis]
MQLKRGSKHSKPLRDKLALAASALLGTTAVVAAEDNSWQVDTAVLLYSEADSRVQAVEPVINLSKDWGDEHISSFKLVVDSLTGASPNGAMAANRPQTFTGPSGNGGYSAGVGETPLDDSFHDQRVALRGGWQQPWSDSSRISVGANVSSEYDFKSLSIDGNYARDFNHKLSTLSFGLNLELDQINAVGGLPQAFSAMPVQNAEGEVEDESADNRDSSDTKQVADFLIGYTQVFSRNFLMQFNLSHSQSSGYQNDPYKLLTVADQGNLIVNPDPNNANGMYLYWYESRPDTRSKDSFFVQGKYSPGEDVIDVSYRYMTDDWGIRSHTIDAKYRWEMGNGWYLEPHLRQYRQTAADFYRAYLQTGIDTDGSAQTALIDYASADPRLADFDATTIGLKIGKVLGVDNELSLRVETYKQTGNVSNNAPAGSDLAGQPAFADMTASWVQLSYGFRW